MKNFLFTILLFASLSPLFAESNHIKLTVYNRGIAQVAEVRPYHLARGENTITFTSIAEKIIAETIQLNALDSGDKIKILYSDFLNERLSLDKLYQNSIDKVLNLTVDEEPVTGRLLNYDGDYLYLEPDSGGIVLIKKSDLDDLIFTEIPEGIVSRPTLYSSVKNEGKPGDVKFELNYLTSGLSWSAYYTAEYSGGNILLGGSFVVENKLDMGFDGAELALIAGEAHMAYDKAVLPRSGDSFTDDAASFSDAEGFFSYYRYPVDGSVDITPKSTRQIPLMEKQSFPAVEKNVMKEGFGIRNLQTMVEFSAPGIPLPEGEISIYKKLKQGEMVFAGEDRIYNTSPGGRVEINVGENFDLQGERKRISHQRLNRDATEDVIRVKLTNGSDKDAKIVVRERVFGDWEIVSATFNGNEVKPETVDSRKIEFNLKLAKNSTGNLEYKVRYEY